jgi:hypothetical protein
MASRNLPQESFNKSELEKLFAIMKQATLETDERFAILEGKLNA